jgi:mannose-6-phosphate isomerase
VARLAKRACKDFVIDDQTPYAEVSILLSLPLSFMSTSLTIVWLHSHFFPKLWMGTHPSGPAVIASHDAETAGTLLKDILHQVPEYAGSIRVLSQWGNDVPFLFKVLSIDQPLSIQSHPDKETAKTLHARDPENYPDDNHKPEMAIALTPFEALCAFRPREQLLLIFSRFHEVRDVIGHEIVDYYRQHGGRDNLRSCFRSLMTADQPVVDSAIRRLADKWQDPSFKATDALESELRHVFLMVHPHYPHDVGCLCLFLLNYIKLNPGEGIFLKANEPHSYLSGDCIECMAKSDNVIRAGFTPKFKDVQQLCQTLSYAPVSPASLIIKPKAKKDRITFSYSSLTKEFAVDQISFDSDAGLSHKFVFEPKESASILIVVRGKFSVPGLGVKAGPGSVYFIPAMLSVSVISGDSELLCFRAFATA